MLRGEKIGLRARHAEDHPILLSELYNDVELSARSEGRPWRPVAPGPKDPKAIDDDPSIVQFSVVELGTDTLVGLAGVWGIDLHHRSAHLGLGLLGAARGKGYGTDVVNTLCRYGFDVRGLHRLQIDTLADNHAMIRAAERVGFVREGVLRSAGWVMGEFLDAAVYGLLAEEWRSAERQE
ncbi:GNAT family N-acetyltransferase [Kitasatospora cheerisanensis]|uniref:GCN5 family acetyltransferase n=1 Tax=Kitasatospora cheerisanensis KCTC 2395 TaxID=1348663 RepID=A0A066YWA3_9ACTN|nr:GNAT family protein [Kitasatospora cheerisanensis]KDN82175.1 GCN5 family acetyltransferase [Kitasatospora cheerisanensis KCTC 2395]